MAKADASGPPSGYFVLSSPNEGENGKLMCPHANCDGFVFSSARACVEHEAEWHAGPYECHECAARFASGPALSRHVVATGHQRWVCNKRGCSMAGVDFGRFAEYEAHAVVDKAAHSGAANGAMNRLDGGSDAAGGSANAGSANADSLDADADADADAGADANGAGMSSQDAYTCLEVCCQKYMKNFKTPRYYSIHANSFGHKAAHQHKLKLATAQLSAAQLQAKQQALREFRCDAQGCPQQGNTFCVSQTFYNHLRTKLHVNAPAGPTMVEEEEEEEEASGDTVCRLKGCNGYRHRFASEANYHRHVTQSLSHHNAGNRKLAPHKRKTRTLPRTGANRARQSARMGVVENGGEQGVGVVAAQPDGGPTTLCDGLYQSVMHPPGLVDAQEHDGYGIGMGHIVEWLNHDQH